MTHHNSGSKKSNLMRKQSRPKKLAGKALRTVDRFVHKQFDRYDKSVQGATGTRDAAPAPRRDAGWLG